MVPPSPPAGGEQSRSASLPRHRRAAIQTPQTRAQGTSLGGPAPTGARNQSGRTDASGCKQPTLLSSKVHAPDNGAHTKRRALKAPTACTNYLNRFHKNHNRFRTLCAPSFSCVQRGVWRGQFLCGWDPFALLAYWAPPVRAAPHPQPIFHIWQCAGTSCFPAITTPDDAGTLTLPGGALPVADPSSPFAYWAPPVRAAPHPQPTFDIGECAGTLCSPQSQPQMKLNFDAFRPFTRPPLTSQPARNCRRP